MTDTIRLNLSNILTFINQPFCETLDKRDHVKALVASIGIGILTLGLLHLACLINSRLKGRVSKKPPISAQKVEGATKKTFSSSSANLSNKILKPQEQLALHASNPFLNLNEDVAKEIIKILDTKSLLKLIRTHHSLTPLSKFAIENLLTRKALHRFLKTPQLIDYVLKVGKDLTSLRLSPYQIKKEDIERVTAGCPNLTDLRITCIVNEVIGTIHLPQKLNALNLSLHRYKVTPDFISHLPQSLTTLKLDAKLAEQDISHLAHLDNLTTLELSHIPMEGIETQWPPKLKKLTLRVCDSFAQAGLLNLPQDLSELALIGNYDLSFEGFAERMKNLKKLTLNIDNNFIFNDNLLRLPHSITHLKIPLCLVTNVGISHLWEGLISLDLLYCSSLTADCLSSLPKSLQSLRCPKQFSEATKEKLRERGIKILD